jgi:capsular polysaccharide biosynthesis protein
MRWFRRDRRNTVGIKDVAEDVATIETCVRTRATFAPGIRRDRRANPFLGWKTKRVTLRVWRLRDVVLDRSLMVLLKDGKVIAETNYLQSPDSIAAAQIRAERLVRPAFDGIVATCCDHWDANYYHWIAHTVPTVHAILQRHPNGGIALLTPRLAPWQNESLDLIGAGAIARIPTDLDAQYFLPVAEYYDFVAGHGDYALSGMSQAAYQGMSERAASAGPQHRRIYIDRSASPNRRAPNEAALVERLRERGFHAARMETLRPAEQVALFRDAGLVVALHGAGLANIGFCRPGAVVYEIVPSHYRNPCFLRMAMQGGLRYWSDMLPSGVPGGVRGGDHTSPWRNDIDIARVMRRIDELEAEMPVG